MERHVRNSIESLGVRQHTQARQNRHAALAVHRQNVPGGDQLHNVGKLGGIEVQLRPRGQHMAVGSQAQEGVESIAVLGIVEPLHTCPLSRCLIAADLAGHAHPAVPGQGEDEIILRDQLHDPLPIEEVKAELR